MNARETDDAVDISDLTVRRGGATVLRSLDVRIGRGRLVGLLGPSGCGKSTLMRAIVGVQRVHGGRVTVLGEPAGSAALRRRVAYTTQSPALYPDLTVAANVLYFARLLDLGRSEADAAITRVSLDGHRDQLTRNLSGGQRARTSLATALLGAPSLLVLDEPTVGQDPLLRRTLWATFRDLADGGATLVVSSHVLDEAEHCDDIVLMREGEVIAAEEREHLTRRLGEVSIEEAFIRLVEDRAP